jgi:Raf kinase inhibitor-like YbhB/YbcL family protein
MRAGQWVVAVILGFVLCAAGIEAQERGAAPGGGQRGGGPAAPAAPAMALTSTSFADGAVIPLKYSGAGEDLSPALTWTNAPPNTVGFVLHMHDTEGTRNKTTDDQLHWLIWTMPTSTTSLPEGVPKGDLKDGSHQTSASGDGTYRGPRFAGNGPLHHYLFEIYAVDTKIDVPGGGDPFETRTKVLQAMQGHVLGKAVYMGRYRRPEGVGQ